MKVQGCQCCDLFLLDMEGIVSIMILLDLKNVHILLTKARNVHILLTKARFC
jgi:hypothetical protein